MTYQEFINTFTVYPSYNKAKAKGFEAHHIIPKDSQKGNPVFDDRRVRLTPSEHAWAHILWDREHGTNSANVFLDMLDLKDRDINSLTYEDCLPYDNLMKAARKQSGEKSTAYYSVPENRQKQSDAMMDYFAVPENRQKTSETTKIGMADPELRQHLSDSQTARWSVPENRQKQSDAMMDYFAVPENRQKTSETTKIGMADPEVRQHMKEIMQKCSYEYHHNNPNKLSWNEFVGEYYKQKSLLFQEL